MHRFKTYHEICYLVFRQMGRFLSGFNLGSMMGKKPDSKSAAPSGGGGGDEGKNGPDPFGSAVDKELASNAKPAAKPAKVLIFIFIND